MAEGREEWLNRMSDTLALDPADLIEIAAMFFETVDERLDNIAQAGASGDMDGLMRLAHGLKGDAANIGFNEISQIARDLEHQGRNKDVIDFDGQLAALRAASRSLRESLEL